ncbi:hypothetical protein JCM6882_006134 [Rhodosporidiobolus microsporus]
MRFAVLSCLASALLALSAVDFTTAAPLVRRQSISQSLFVDFTDTTPTLYRSTSQYQCPPAHVFLSGKHAPFTVDVIKFPFEADKVACQEVVANVATNVSAVDRLMWLPQKYHEGEVAVRVTDAEGGAAYTVMKRIEDGDAEHCSDLTPPGWFSEYWPLLFVIPGELLALAIILSVLAKRDAEHKLVVARLDGLRRLIKGEPEEELPTTEAEAETVPQTEEHADEEARLVMEEAPAYNEKNAA